MKGFYIQSRICSVFVEADGRGVKETVLIYDDAELKSKYQKESCSPDQFPLPKLIDSMKKYLSGEAVTFDFDCALSGYTELEKKILLLVKGIPYGKTMTYEQIAGRVGNKNLRRVVGRALKKNRCPIIIPCHRVIGKGGRLTGFSADGGTELKAKLLDMESAMKKI